jgi:hypothetical protein
MYIFNALNNSIAYSSRDIFLLRNPVCYISWINLGALLSSWITLLNSAVISLTNMSNPEYFENGRKLEIFGLGEDALVTVNVWCVSFLGLRALDFLRGTGIKMATFVLMLQEISWNVSLSLKSCNYPDISFRTH